MTKRIASMVMAILMVVSLLPLGVFAEDGEVGCTHQHDESCGYAAAAEEVPCDQGCADEDGDGVTDHVEGCLYQPAVEEQPCSHVCDDTCAPQPEDTDSEDAEQDEELLPEEAVQDEEPLREDTQDEDTQDEELLSEDTEADTEECICESCCDKETICESCPVCKEDSTACWLRMYGISLFSLRTYGSDYVHYEQVPGFSSENVPGTTINILGVHSDGTEFQTTYHYTSGEKGYVVQRNDNLANATITADASLVNGGRYVKLSYTVANNTSNAISDGKLGIYADVQIGDNDDATVEVITGSNRKAIGLRMVDSHTSCNTKGKQFNLYFADAYGVTDAQRYWFGRFSNRKSQLESGGNSTASEFIPEDLTGTDSGLAVFWDGIELNIGEKRTYSLIIGVGEKADPPKWDTSNPVTLTMSADATQDDKILNVTARVKDADGVEDQLYYSVNSGSENTLGGPVTGDGVTEKTIIGTIDLNGLADGTYSYQFWVVNDRGVTSDKVTRTITISNGSVTGDVTFVHAHRYAYSADGAVITESCACDHSATAIIHAPTDLSYSGSAKEATVSYSDGWQGGELNITYSPTDHVNAGQVTASISKGNATASVVYTITKAAGSGSVTMADWTYGGTASSPVPTSDKNGVINVIYHYSGRNGTTYSSDTCPTEAGDYTVKATFAATTNYKQATATADFTIAKAPVSFTVSDNTSTYDGTHKDANVTQTKGQLPSIGEHFTVSYKQNGQPVTPKNAGTYEIWVTLGSNNFKFSGKGDTERSMQVGTLSVNKATLTPSVAAVYNKTYNGSTATTGTLSLAGAVNGEQPTATGTFAFTSKNAGENKTVNVTGITLSGTWGEKYQLSTDKLDNVSTTAAITKKSLSVENVDVKDKPFDGTTTAEFEGTPSLRGVVGQDNVTLVYGTPFFKSDAVGVQPVNFTDFSLDGSDVANYSLTQPASVTAEITVSEKHLDLSGIAAEEGGQIPNEVFIDGNPYQIRGNGENAYLALPEGSSLLTTHTEAITGEPGEMNKPYPDTMRVYLVVEKTDSSGRTSKTLREVTALYDLLKYAGCSIRIDGIQGIRMITSIDQSNKEKLLRQEGLAGYQLVEYGTVVSWANENPHPTLANCLKKGVAYGVGDRGVFQDPVFGVSDGRMQYTNVLINFTMEQCAQELAMRPYIILKDADGEQITLYGGTVVRSIGYIAYQNRNVFQPGSGEYQYVWQIIHGVYGERFDGTTQEKGGNNG